LKAENKDSVGILLVNLGGPDSLASVRPFLFNLFSDREIIRLGPPFLQKPIAFLISSMRAGKTRAAYSLIGGKSPISEMTFAQAKALEAGLEGSTFRVFVGMRYWHPFIGDVVTRMHEEGIRKVLALSLYPHYSVATTGSSLSALRKALSAHPDMSVHAIESWYDHPLYVSALVENIEKGMQVFQSSNAELRSAQADVHVLFSAHSLPKKFIQEGDPYVDHVMATIRAVTARVDIPWSLSYQSKSGPVAWLEPSTEEMLEKLAAKGVKNLLVVPISFVSDHIETLYEIDMLYKNMAAGLGMRLERAGSLNLSPAFIAALRDIVLNGTKEAGWKE
jgi:ferrochelatase